MRVFVVVAGLVASGLWASAQAAANPYTGPDAGTVQFFRSPSGNISCEINFQRGSGISDSAYCMSRQPTQHAEISPDGSLADLCLNDPSCGSDPPMNEGVLPYGQSAVLGPFTCVSEEFGMTCTANGRGFTISTSGISLV